MEVRELIYITVLGVQAPDNGGGRPQQSSGAQVRSYRLKCFGLYRRLPLVIKAVEPLRFLT